MITCLCSCPETSHALGEGICECGCPAFRPFRLYGPDDEMHDRQHDGIAEEFLKLHSMTVEITGEHMWTLLPEPEDLPRPEPTRDQGSSAYPG